MESGAAPSGRFSRSEPDKVSRVWGSGTVVTPTGGVGVGVSLGLVPGVGVGLGSGLGSGEGLGVRA